MKFRISKEIFLDGLQQVQHIVSNRTTLPILSNVLIEAKDGKLKLTTTDLDTGVSGSVEAQVSEEGTTTLPVRRLASIIKELPAETVDISVDGSHTATIMSGPSVFKILGLPEADFPALPSFDEGKDYSIPPEVLREGIKRTIYAISTDETRYVLNGIYCKFQEGKMILVATDGRRLAMVEAELEFPSNHEGEIIIPTKAVQEIARLLDGVEEKNIRVLVNENQIAVDVDGKYLVSKLIDGSYPNYRQVIPGEKNETIILSREALYDTVRRVSLLSSEKSSSIKLVFSKGLLELQANSPDIGEAHESVPINYEGEEMKIAFNPDFLMAPLRHLENDEVSLDIIDEMSPGVLRADGAFLYVIMPMRVTG